MHRDIVDPPQRPLDEASSTTKRILNLLDRSDEWFEYSITDKLCYHHEPTSIVLSINCNTDKLELVTVQWPNKYSPGKQNRDGFYLTLSSNESEHVSRKILKIRENMVEPSEGLREECLCEYIDSFMRKDAQLS